MSAPTPSHVSALLDACQELLFLTGQGVGARCDSCRGAIPQGMCHRCSRVLAAKAAIEAARAPLHEPAEPVQRERLIALLASAAVALTDFKNAQPGAFWRAGLLREMQAALLESTGATVSR